VLNSTGIPSRRPRPPRNESIMIFAHRASSPNSIRQTQQTRHIHWFFELLILPLSFALTLGPCLAQTNGSALRGSNTGTAKADATNPDAGTSAEVVRVKYRGPVSLAPFKCDAVTRSSFIERVCYDAANLYMLIDLTGAWYHYCEIDAGTVSNLMAADSMGRFYDQSIKGRFDCRTLRVPHY
jgi:hypothetical protein